MFYNLYVSVYNTPPPFRAQIGGKNCGLYTVKDGMILFDLYNLPYFLNCIVIFVDTCFGIYVGALQHDGMQKLGSTS